MKTPQLDQEALEAVAQTFKVLAEPLRLRILQELQGGELSVTELCQNVSASQPNVSKHLKILSEARMVKKRQAGNTVFYMIAEPMVYRLCDLVCQGVKKRLERQIRIFSRNRPGNTKSHIAGRMQ